MRLAAALAVASFALWTVPAAALPPEGAAVPATDETADAASGGTLDARSPETREAEQEDAAASVAAGETPDADGVVTIVVTATRTPRPVRSLPWAVTVLPREELERSPALTQDALVRAAPSVATFRRNTSLVADPTSQGLNLRGVGPSGVSRALVLLDGVPVNEPFGSWIFWRAVPTLGIDRVEVAPGPASAAYGTGAMGGVVQLVSRPLTPSTLDASASGGSFGTATGAVRATHRWDQFAAGLEAELLRTDGFRIVSPSIAGPVDVRARGDHVSAVARGESTLPGEGTVNARLGYFAQEQSGGTALTNSSARLLDASARARWSLASGETQLAAYHRRSLFLQDRARIAPDRSTEALSAEQRVPASDLGVIATWEGKPVEIGGRHLPSAGADLRWVLGESSETLHPAASSPASLRRRLTGGAQQFAGVFLQDELSWGRLGAVASLRWDLWRNSDGLRVLRFGDGRVDTTTFAPRIEQQLSPRLGVHYDAGAFSLRSAAGTGFRAPTLNELYRPFQVGTILTAANEALVAERLLGAEAGIDVHPTTAWVLRATYFWNRLDNPVTNVTLAEPLPGGAQRQRQNLGAAVIHGVETGLEATLRPDLALQLGYTWVDARVSDAPGLPELVGKRLAQDPEHRATVGLTFDRPEWFTATAQARFVGPQYEDDLNTSPMGGYLVIDASVSRRLAYGLEVFAAVENLLDRRYLVGRAGIDTFGQPLTLRAGLRLRAGR